MTLLFVELSEQNGGQAKSLVFQCARRYRRERKPVPGKICRATIAYNFGKATWSCVEPRSAATSREIILDVARQAAAYLSGLAGRCRPTGRRQSGRCMPRRKGGHPPALGPTDAVKRAPASARATLRAMRTMSGMPEAHLGFACRARSAPCGASAKLGTPPLAPDRRGQNMGMAWEAEAAATLAIGHEARRTSSIARPPSAGLELSSIG